MDIRELAPLRGARRGEVLVTDEQKKKIRDGWRTVTSEFAAELGSFEDLLGANLLWPCEICSVPTARAISSPDPIRFGT
jgi:hypothetical protein